MKKRALSLLLALALLGGLLIPAAGAQEPQTADADVSEYVLHLGGLLPDAQELRPRGDNSAVKQALYSGLLAWQGSIDISAYNVQPDDLTGLYAQVLNEHPELFYVSGGLSYSCGEAAVSSVSPRYDNGYTAMDVVNYQTVVQRIVGMMEADWSDLEKVLFLHDYLVTHCEYDLTYSRYTAYDALVVGSAVCQGYAEAFRDLCLVSGIPAVLITSWAIDHAWNLVTVGGERFYVDCTWDDPSNQWYEAYCGHGNFLLSRAGMEATKHRGTDWTDGANNVYNNDMTSTRYDSGAWWADVRTAVPMIGHIGAFAVTSDMDNFYLRDMRTGATSAYSLPARAVWPVFGNSYSYWAMNLCTFAAMDGQFYFALPTEIWSATTSGRTERVYALTQEELSQGYAYGIVADGDTLYYNIGTEPCNTDFTRVALSGTGSQHGEADGFAYTLLSDGTASVTGCDLTGNVVIPGKLDGYTVTNLAAELFYGQSGITSVTIPATVTGFGEDPSDNDWDYVFSYCYDLTSINVEQGNKVFCSVDGVLYSKDRTTLINYPCNRAGAVYHAQPETICCTAFASCRNLKFLFLDNADTWWYTYTFYNDPDLTVFYLPGGDAEQKAESDLHYGRVQDGSYGNPWPWQKSTDSLCALPDDLRVIESGAFSGTQLPWVIAPAGCTRIEKDAFADSGLAYLRVGKNTVIDTGALPDSVVVERVS